MAFTVGREDLAVGGHALLGLDPPGAEEVGVDGFMRYMFRKPIVPQLGSHIPKAWE